MDNSGDNGLSDEDNSNENTVEVADNSDWNTKIETIDRRDVSHLGENDAGGQYIVHEGDQKRRRQTQYR